MTSSNIIRFERHMKTLDGLLATDIQQEMVKETSRIYTAIIRSSIYSVTNGGRLRGVGKNGARVGVRVTQQRSDTALVQATGPLHLIERDTSAHLIPRTTGVRRRRTAAGRLSHKRESTGRVLSGRKLLVINGSVVTGPVLHPGTKGKHPFDIGYVAAEGAALAAATSIFSKSLARVFNG